MIFQTADKADSAFQKAAVPTWFGKTRNNDLISLDGEPMNFQSSCHEHHEQRLRMIKIFAKDDLLLRMHIFFFAAKITPDVSAERTEMGSCRSRTFGRCCPRQDVRMA